MNDNWAYSTPISLRILQECVRESPCCGAFVNGELCAWIMVRGICPYPCDVLATFAAFVGIECFLLSPSLL